MGKTPRWFSVNDAFRHFADPALLRRVDELEPHARSYNKHTEHLHKEHRKLCRQIHLAMIERLKRGELIACGLDKHGPITEGVLSIAPERWSILNIRYDLDWVVAPGGLILVDVKICEATEFDTANSEQRETASNGGFEHSTDYRNVRSNGFEFSLGPKQADVIRKLHAASQTHTPWVHGKLLLDEDTRSTSIRDLFKSKENWRKLIESDGNGRYRLNLPVDRQL